MGSFMYGDRHSVAVFIPTMGRIGHSKQITLREFETFSPHEWYKQVHLVCPPEEAVHHTAYHSLTRIIPCDAKGISATRQEICNYCHATGIDYAIIIDDDMYFSVRREPESDVLLRIDASNFCRMLDTLYSWLEDGYPLVGVSARQGNNTIEPAYRDVTRQMNMHGVNVNRLRSQGIRWDDVQFMEDFHVTLSLLEQGLPNRVSYEFCWNQRKSGSAGGCSSYRTPETQAKAAHRLREIHGDVVKIVQKNSSSQAGAMTERTDVNVQWRKAFNSELHQKAVLAGICPEADLSSGKRIKW